MSIELLEYDPGDPKGREAMWKCRRQLLADDEHHVPLRGTETLDRAHDLEGLLGPKSSPQGTSRLFLAGFKGKPAGRAAISVPSQDPSEARLSYFDCKNDRRVFDGLMARIEPWCRSQGVQTLAGPFSPTLEGEVGCLTGDPAAPPTVLLPHHPRFYWTLFEGYGFVRTTARHCLVTDRDRLEPHPLFNRILRIGGATQRKDPELSLRSSSFDRLDEDLALASQLFAEANRDGWGLGLLPQNALAESLREQRRELVLDLFVFLERSGTAIGTLLAIPDNSRRAHELLQYRRPFQGVARRLHKHTVDRLRILGISLIREEAHLGNFAYLMREFLTQALSRDFSEVEVSWIPEEHHRFQAQIARMTGASLYRTYVGYRLTL